MTMNTWIRKLKEEKLLVALAVIIWLFLFLTTVSKTYFYYLRHGIEFETGYTFARAFLIWGVIALFAPLFIYLARRFPVERRTYTHVGLHVLIGLLFVPIHAMLFRALMTLWYQGGGASWATYWESIPVIMTWLGIIGPFSYWIIILAYNFRKYYEQYRARQVRNTEMEAELASIRLHVLKVQLHPHFLFNTLHNINSLLHEAPEKAKQVLMLLKRFLQTSISRVNEQQVPLREELEFTGIYLDIETTRFSNRLTVEKDIAADTLGAMVPSFLLQPLVENAVKHGISKKLRPGILRITARTRDERLCLAIEDNGPGLNGTMNTKGVGLDNIRQRLVQLYADARFGLEPSALGGLKVNIDIPLQKDTDTDNN